MSERSVKARHVVVEVPATIANLGAGFDCLGIAVDRSLRVEVTAVAPGSGRAGFEITGEGAGEIPAGRGNRFLEALEAGLRERTGPAGPEAADPETAWHVHMHSDIPVARGLGSSAAAVVAGLLAAAAIAGSDADPAERRRLLVTAAAMEGHPDNVAPALLGGLVASLVAREDVVGGDVAGGDFARDDRADIAAYPFETPAALRVVLLVPERRTPTPAMRAILPERIPRTDAVANLARAAVAMAGIASGDWTALRFLNDDRLHEPYRAEVYRELPSLLAAARAAGALLACLAGSGSSVAAFSLGDAAEAERIAGALSSAARDAGLPARTLILGARNGGARILEAG